MPKRRSRYACIACRTRKVRCDTDLRGLPCTNCELDDAKCFIKPRASKRRASLQRCRSQDVSLAVNLESLSGDLPIASGANDAEGYSSWEFDDMMAFPEVIFTSAESPETLQDHHLETAPLIGINESRKSRSISKDDTENGVDICSTPVVQFSSLGGLDSPEQSRIFPCQMGGSGSLFDRNSNFLTSSCYQFVEMDALWDIDSRTALFLEQRGCLHLPVKRILDEFIQQYFLHIHPLIPILNEFRFWRMYCNDGQGKRNHDRLPLLLFQAMLFVSSPTLLDLSSPENDAVKAQVALLLTYYTQSTTDRTNTYWLKIAIHHAQTAGAPSYETSDNNSREKGQLKRLWWCCILRDRVMALSSRRSLQIRAEDFDFSNDGLTENDLRDEMNGSIVYDAKTKKVLIELIVMLCELGVVLNDILADVYPEQPSKRTRIRESPERLKALSVTLDHWYEKAFLRFRIPTTLSGAHKSLILFTNILYTYYNTAQACLCKQIMLLTVTTDTGHEAQECRLQAQSQLNRSLRNMFDDLMELKELELAKYLPNTFVEFCAFSFIWYLLDTRLIPPNKRLFQFPQGLQTYTDLMDGFKPLYESTDGKLQCIDKIVSYIQTNEGLEPSVQELGVSEDAPSVGPVTHWDSTTVEPFRNAWVSILSNTPYKYLRIVLTVEYSLSKGQFPAEVDFPEALRTD
ncbi:hypothetical protein B0T10DRAFT_417581 [Thelonectria olida]|uniref:Zn(2)-C6 fungal-type domain-containing protein n=1 Tax=Thelonectria olida TaxID=1576542 RepID=A0A9P8VQY8_9HYPO|nr:hypothetical protein B0T10DRAFT_417581 [Thelonectria olida]